MWTNFTEFLTIFVNVMIDRIVLSPYYLVLAIRNMLYDKGILASRKADVPTICVGNVTVGGTGKTPHVELILRMLGETEEWSGSHLAVLSRGYKRESSGFQQVTDRGSAAMFGDEPFQIKKKNPGVTVAVDKDRLEGCRFLASPGELGKSRAGRKCWNRDFPASDLIVLDDAFQYRKLVADLNVVLVDFNRPVFEDSLLPFGRLRDLPGRIFKADALIVTKCVQGMTQEEKACFLKRLHYTDFDPVTSTALNRRGVRQHVFFTYIKYEAPKNVYVTSNPRYFYTKKIVLFTGIANNIPFRNYLSDSYKILKLFNFEDHHKFSDRDIRKITDIIRENPTAAVVTTEKDAQRILDYVGMPENLTDRMFYIPISSEFVTGEEKEKFRELLSGLRRS